MGQTICTATKDDVETSAAVLARAFADDPPCAWILRNDKDRTKKVGPFVPDCAPH
jgi:hypothetical protein